VTFFSSLRGNINIFTDLIIESIKFAAELDGDCALETEVKVNLTKVSLSEVDNILINASDGCRLGTLDNTKLMHGLSILR
jgi:hypothetical protein